MVMKVSDEVGQPKGQPTPNSVIQLSEAQFNRLVELLIPGYELAKAMLAEHERISAENRAQAAAEGQPETH